MLHHPNLDGDEHRNEVGSGDVSDWLLRHNYPDDYELQLLCRKCHGKAHRDHNAAVKARRDEAVGMTAHTALDIDGVITDFTNQVFVPTFNALHGTSHPKNYRPEQWELGVEFSAKEERDAVWKSPELLHFLALAKPLPHALSYAKTLSQCSVFITSRGFGESGAEIRSLTIRWLRDLGLTQKIHFAHAKDKVSVAQALGCTTAWEDHPD